MTGHGDVNRDSLVPVRKERARLAGTKLWSLSEVGLFLPLPALHSIRKLAKILPLGGAGGVDPS